MPLKTARNTLQKENFLILPLLGVNRHVKTEWRTLHRAFGGVGLLDLVVEHTIGMINIFVQHYGAGTTIAMKYEASLEALQLELGCLGNPLMEDYTRYHLMATDSWVKSFWERLHYYRFRLHINYTAIHLPRRNDSTLTSLFVRGGHTGDQIQALNRCRISHRLLFLSDITLACATTVESL